MPGRPGVWSSVGWDHGRADTRPNQFGQNRNQGTGKNGNRALLALSGGLQPDLYAFETLNGSRPPTAGHPERTAGILLSPTTGVLTRARVAVHRGERAGLDQDYTPDAPPGGRGSVGICQNCRRPHFPVYSAPGSPYVLGGPEGDPRPEGPADVLDPGCVDQGGYRTQPPRPGLAASLRCRPGLDGLRGGGFAPPLFFCPTPGHQKARSDARYPSRLRRVSSMRSPPNFRISSSARTSRTTASPTTPAATIGIVSVRSR